MRDYFEASANFIDEIFLAKENSDQIISTKLDLTDAREATNFLSQAIYSLKGAPHLPLIYQEQQLTHQGSMDGFCWTKCHLRSIYF